MKLKNAKSFSETKLWRKLNAVAKKVGMKVVYPVLLLYYLFRSSEVPLKSKSLIAGAIAYFILPFDAFPDLLPIVGYADDLSLLLATIYQLLNYVSPEILEQTRNKIQEWFSNKDEALAMENKILKQIGQKNNTKN